MRPLANPHEAYHKVAFDARIEVSDTAQLVHLCYEQLIGALGTAVHADRIDDNMLRSRSLTRALSAITALQMGVSGENDVAGALRHFYEAARRTVLDCVPQFDTDALMRLRGDVSDIATAMQAAPIGQSANGSF
ncbi:MAG: flagellar protein FliS [Novosphingobium sp.]|nr:flagellar protein FliS [Novosphingobium sp.]